MNAFNRIPFLPARFVASREGVIKSLAYEKSYVNSRGTRYTRHHKERILKARMQLKGGVATHGYEKQLMVNIYLGDSRENPKFSQMRVAMLVAATYHGLPYDRSDASETQKWRLAFRDGDRNNVAADNLEWLPNFGTSAPGNASMATYQANRAGWLNRKQETAAEMAARMGYSYEEAA